MIIWKITYSEDEMRSSMKIISTPGTHYKRSGNVTGEVTKQIGWDMTRPLKKELGILFHFIRKTASLPKKYIPEI